MSKFVYYEDFEYFLKQKDGKSIKENLLQLPYNIQKGKLNLYLLYN